MSSGQPSKVIAAKARTTRSRLNVHTCSGDCRFCHSKRTHLQYVYSLLARRNATGYSAWSKAGRTKGFCQTESCLFSTSSRGYCVGFILVLPQLDSRMFSWSHQSGWPISYAAVCRRAVHPIRKSFTPTLGLQAKAHFTAKHRLLNPRLESLSVEKQQELRDILGYSALLKQALGKKVSVNRTISHQMYILPYWFVQGKQIQQPTITACLKSIKNWKLLILNYHRCRWTNATVEGGTTK